MTMIKKMKKRRRRETIDPADMRSWANDDHRMEGMDEFKRILNSPGQEQERQNCIDDGVHARTKFAEWGLFYIEGQKDPEKFPLFDPNWGKTKIPSATVFSVYESHEDRPKRDRQVVFILPPPQGTNAEHRDPMWRCTYTPYRGKKKNKKKGISRS